MIKVLLYKTRGKYAFTLAEVLITLGIIGIVAALTMPALLGNFKKKSTVTQLSKAYSVVQNAVKMSVAKNGDVDSWEEWAPASVWYRKDMNGAVKNKLLPFFNGAKYYEGKGFSGSNWVTLCSDTLNHDNANYIQYTYMDGKQKVGTTGDTLYPSIQTMDGACISFSDPRDNKTIEVTIDINGPKSKPNRYGVDTFKYVLFYKDGSLKPYAYDWDYDDLTSQSKINACTNKYPYAGGLACSAKIISDGWKIKDDYPF